MSSADPEILRANARKEAAKWLAASVASAPEPVRKCLSDIVVQLAADNVPQRQFDSGWRQLGRALGFLPSTERRRSSRGSEVTGNAAPGSAGKTAAKGEQTSSELSRAAARNRRLADTHAAKACELEERLAKMSKDGKVSGSGDEPAEEPSLEELIAKPVEEFELGPEAEAAVQQYADEFVARAMLGDGPEPAVQGECEGLMNAAVVATEQEHITLEAPLPPDVPAESVVHTFTKPTVRYDFSMSVKRIELDVTKKLVKTEDGTAIISASTAAYGPRRFSVTWGALATLACMVGQFALPLNRLATMLSTSMRTFTAGGLGRMLHYVAVRFFPIYIELFHQLADSRNLSGDDTSSRVVEVSSYFKKTSGSPDKQTPPPWESYANPEAANEQYEEVIRQRQAQLVARAAGNAEAKRAKLKEPSLCVQVGRELTFESPRRDGKGAKRSFNTTVVTGRSVDDDPKSLIVFYRTHFGSFGDLLEMLLRQRSPRHRLVVIQSDLSSTNLVTDAELLRRFVLTTAGCAAHARRPFALYEDDDPIYAPLMLDQFRQLAFHERALDQVGRNRANVEAVRQGDSKPVWLFIRKIAEKMIHKWARTTPLGTAARYIVKHFDRLTAYLQDPTLAASNNLRERLLRTEKLIQDSSLFRRTIEGRVVIDIVRSILQTAVAANVSVHEYLVDILKADPDEVSEHPERYTPYAWSQRRLNEMDPENLPPEQKTAA